MANSLLITKLSDDSFSFVLNGDTANTIINLRNDMTSVGNEAHFKTSNGANLIKEQQILYNEVIIVDGATLPTASSSLDLRVKLRSVGFWDWLTSGGSGVDRFDELIDTFDYFGQDGKTVIVDESQLKLIPVDFPDVSGLSVFPTPLIAFKMLRVNSTATAYEFVDQPVGLNSLVQEDIYDGLSATFTLPFTAKLSAVFWNGALLRNMDWTQLGNTYTINFTPTVNDVFQPVGII